MNNVENTDREIPLVASPDPSGFSTLPSVSHFSHPPCSLTLSHSLSLFFSVSLSPFEYTQIHKKLCRVPAGSPWQRALFLVLQSWRNIYTIRDFNTLPESLHVYTSDEWHPEGEIKELLKVTNSEVTLWALTRNIPTRFSCVINIGPVSQTEIKTKF